METPHHHVFFTLLIALLPSLIPNVDFRLVVEELKWKNLKNAFQRKKFFQTLFFVFSFSFFDVFTDFRYAGSVDEHDCPFKNLSSECGGLHFYHVQNSTYMFISLPAIMLVVASLQTKFAFFSHNLVRVKMAKRLGCCCNEELLRIVAGGLSFLFNLFLILSVVCVCWLGIIWAELHDHDHDRDHKDTLDIFGFGLAIASTIPLLGTKFLALFAHGPEMRKLVVRTTSSECQFESALQLWLVIWIFQSTGEYKGLDWLLSAITSILLIGKSGTESFFTFSEHISFDEAPLKEKLGLLLQYAPVFILSALFRIVSLALICDRDLIYPWMAFAIGLPIIVLCILKVARCWESIEDLTPGHILLGVLGELTSICLWGEKTREASKNFCLGMASFILVLNTIFLLDIYSDPLRGLGSWYHKNSTSAIPSNAGISDRYQALDEVFDLELADFWKTEVIACLCCGWLTFPLVYLQIWKTVKSL